MPDAEKIEVNPNPQDVGDLTDEQLEAALVDADVNVEGDLGADMEFGEVEETPVEGDEDEDSEADSDDDATEGDGDDDGDGEDEDGEADADDGEDDEAIPAATREAMEAVLERIELMEAERDQLNAKLEKAEILRDRNAGKLGSLMQKLEKRDTSRADDDFSDDDAESDSTQSKKDLSAGEEALNEIRQEKVSRSVNNAAQDFYRENAEFFDALEKEAGAEKAEAFQADLIARVQAANQEVGEEILTMSPKMAGKMAHAVIKACFADMRVDLLRDFKNGASEKAEQSRRAIRARKKGAAGTRSNKRPATSTTKNKSLSQMSDKELDAALAQAAGSFD